MVVLSMLFHLTCETGTKLSPLMVKVRSVEPTVADEGERLVMDGLG